MEDVGSTGNANFAPAIQLSIRASVMMCLLACIVWIPAVRKPFPNQIQARIPLVICLFVFTINPHVEAGPECPHDATDGILDSCAQEWVDGEDEQADHQRNPCLDLVRKWLPNCWNPHNGSQEAHHHRSTYCELKSSCEARSRGCGLLLL